ncbi:MAG: prolipoprotein diacylglyceryl transferase [Candidatus Doudnabacteria bacterium CG10_big_fil_rev_8_21_14_0_10_42_18]|uniref:Phosphatidylglycerol--prolipoprotein diacylglyceryl transferase n=1 Tax=Candidatus Doudnabacteria bacterium CG10_big_fil_rev_8_21_14_0_10_42_18 TaxID=1974552 RepID=A0A2H0VBY6_9BACT|nr:MAG: prolipoprotein diacylglyceryl transferase [Candidatus Doudnabacteria bacterium CG10_big_fil_rev_8_21_14_0_10_42_18]
MKKTYLLIVFLFLALAYSLSQVFSGNWILPQGFFVGPIEIRYYGIIMALAVGAGYYLAVQTAENNRLSKKQAEDLLFWVIIGGFVGARLYHVLSGFGYYFQNPLSSFQVWNGGLSIYGAILGGLIVILLYAKRYTLNPWHLFDWLAPSVLLGQIIGRFGNMFNYEAFGYPAGILWKMFVPPEFRPVSFWGFQFFHPWFLYEILGNVIIFVFLMVVLKSRLKGKRGALFLTYILLYNSVRFLLEFSRIDSVFVGYFRQNAIASLVLILFSAAALKFIKRNEQVS